MRRQSAKPIGACAAGVPPTSDFGGVVSGYCIGKPSGVLGAVLPHMGRLSLLHGCNQASEPNLNGTQIADLINFQLCVQLAVIL